MGSRDLSGSKRSPAVLRLPAALRLPLGLRLLPAPLVLPTCHLFITPLALCVAALLWMPGSAAAQESPVLLEAISVLPVEGPESNQPSGLFVHNDTLYTVSDKHDDTIFRIELREDVAVFVLHIRFDAPKPFGVFRLDLEGITRDDDGSFYLASEGAFAILKVDADGKKASWVTTSLRKTGASAGLFQTRGGYLEGITLMARDRFLVTAETGALRPDRSRHGPGAADRGDRQSWLGEQLHGAAP